MYCLSTEPKHLSYIEQLGYTPVGLGKKKYSRKWQTDKFKKSIDYKNEFYGEYTFHYKLWKNSYNKIYGWIGFCQYRKFWTEKKINKEINNIKELEKIILKKIPKKVANFDVIIGEDLYVNKFKFSKFIKHNLKNMILDPSFFFNKKKRTIKFHFDMMHGSGNLDRAIKFLPKEEKDDFKEYVNSNTSFSPHNMFICKHKDILFSYYDSVFPWLKKCEKLFGFKNLNTYGTKRIYGFLAERYLSFWFRKYTKFKTLPIYFKDINNFL